MGVSKVQIKSRVIMSALGLLVLNITTASFAVAEDQALLDDRQRLLEAVESKGKDAIPRLKNALADERKAMNLTAVHLLIHMGEAGLEGIEKALTHPDVKVRRTAILGLARMDELNDYWPTILMDDHPAIRREVQLNLLKNHPLPEGKEWERVLTELAQMYTDAPESRRRHVVELFTSFERLTPQSRRVLIMATEDQDDNIRRTAFEGILNHIDRDWEKAGELMAAAQADDSEEIQDIGLKMKWKLLEVEQVRLPRKGWRFKLDPEDIGREKKWYKPDYDDSEWRTDVPIESSWKNHIADHYDGTAWYRRSFEVPEFPDWDRAYLHFEGVDEQAWVWLNGENVGSHTMGPEGWNIPFVLDVADAVKPGERNHITVRAANTTGGAGIWRPVRLRVLNTDILNQP